MWRAICTLASSSLLLIVALAPAADEPANFPHPVMRSSFPVKVANRTVIELYGPIAGYSAESRAKAAIERIQKVLEAGGDPAITFESVEDGKATRMLLGGQHILLVTPVDIDAQAGETTPIVAREAGRRLEQAIREWREQETPRYLVLAVGHALVATLLYGVILWLIFRVSRWARRRLSVAAAARTEKLHLGGVRLFDFGGVLLLTRRLFTLTAWIAGLVLASAWLTYVLEKFPYTRPWGEHLEGNILDVLKEIALAMAAAMPGLMFVVVIIVIARAIIRVAGAFFDGVESRGLDLGWIDPDTAKPTRRIFNFVICVFALAMAYPYLPGAQTEAFKGLSVLVGLMVSLGASSVVGQAFNGLILMYARAFRTGDYVRIGDVEGTVVQIGMFATRIRTGMGEEITLPNSGVMATTTKNYSRAVAGAGYMVDTVVTIGYSTPWRQVHAMLEEAARRTSDIAADPPPTVRQTALSDFYVEYRLFAYTPAKTPRARIEVLNDMHSRIQDVFNEYGVQIMSPHYMMDPREPQVVPRDKQAPPPARPDRQP